MSKKEIRALEKQQKKEAAFRKIKAQEKLPFWTLFRYKYLTTYFAGKLGIAIFRFVLLFGLSFVILYPYLSKIFFSFMGREDFVDVTVILIAKYPTLDTYKAILRDNQYFQALLNSSMLSLLCAVIQTISCTIVGYGFSKFKFRFKKLLFTCVIFMMIVPHDTIQLSLFMKFRYFDIWGLKLPADWAINNIWGLGDVFSNIYVFIHNIFTPASKDIVSTWEGLNLLNSNWPLTLMSLTCLGFKNGLYIYIMRQYFNGVPDELEEAAYVDGAGVYKTFVKIIIPMSTTMLVTIFMFAFAWQWSDMFYTDLFYTTNTNVLLPDIVKVPSSLDTDYAAQTAYESAARNTCGLLILAPLVVLYLFAQRTMIEGVERSGITG